MSSQLDLSTEFNFIPFKVGKVKGLKSRRLRWLVISLLSTIMSLLLVKAVEAKIEHQIDQTALEFGQHLSGVFETLHVNKGTEQRSQKSEVLRLGVNGLGMIVQAAHITATRTELDEIFSTFARRCRLPITETPPTSSDEAPLFAAPLIEARGEKESYLYCLRPKRAINAEGIQATLTEFSHAQDLSAMGQFQGLYLRSDGNRHQLLIMETEGAALLKQAFNQHQDVPGSDMKQLPRPAGRRNMSLLYNDHPHFNSYVMPQSSKDALALYTAQLQASGISLISPTTTAADKKSLIARTASDTYLIIAHERRARESTSSATYVPAPSSLLSVTRLVR